MRKEVKHKFFVYECIIRHLGALWELGGQFRNCLR